MQQQCITRKICNYGSEPCEAQSGVALGVFDCIAHMLLQIGIVAFHSLLCWEQRIIQATAVRSKYGNLSPALPQLKCVISL